MRTTMRHSLTNTERNSVARLVALASTLLTSVACHDAATSPVAPVSPSLNVSSDGTWMVNSLADPGDGTCSNNECTLREAIAAAQDGERVTFKDNLSGTIALTAGRLTVNKSLTIEARDPSQISVDGQGATTVFVVGDPFHPFLVNLINLTVTGGGGSVGGGIRLLFGSTLNVIGSVVTGNHMEGHGGGISASKSTLRVARSTVAGNTATGSGGGISVDDGDLTVSRSTISSNRATNGAGIYVDCTAECSSFGTSIRSSTITLNTMEPTGGGGGVATHTTVTTVSNTIIAGNGRQDEGADPNADCLFEQAPPQSFGYNLTSPDTGCLLTSPTDIVLQGVSQLFTSVLSRALAANGGTRPTHALIERGPAVDAGYCPGESDDQRGFPRPFDDLRMPNALDGCDIGAYEWNPPPTGKPKGKP